MKDIKTHKKLLYLHLVKERSLHAHVVKLVDMPS